FPRAQRGWRWIEPDEIARDIGNAVPADGSRGRVAIGRDDLERQPGDAEAAGIAGKDRRHRAGLAAVQREVEARDVEGAVDPGRRDEFDGLPRDGIDDRER